MTTDIRDQLQAALGGGYAVERDLGGPAALRRWFAGTLQCDPRFALLLRRVGLPPAR